MKTLNLLTCMAFLAIIGLGSCKDDTIVTSSVSVITNDSATITGYATAELNLQTFGIEAVPNGTTLLVSVKYSDLNPAAGATAGSWQKSVIITDGKYTVKVPTTSQGVAVNITPSSFESDQTQVSGSLVSKVKCLYTVGSVTIPAVVPNQIVTPAVISYTFTTPATYIEKVNISGIAQAELDASNIGLENLPDNTYIYFSTTSISASGNWIDSVKVQSGKFSINVPKGITINWEVKKFTYPKKVWVPNFTDPTLSTYQTVNTDYSISSSETFSKNTTNVPISTSIESNPDTWVSTTLSGTAKAELDGTNAGLENLPDGTKLYFSTSIWGATATVTNGAFTLSVPMNTTISVYYFMNLNQTNLSGDITSHTFKIDTSFFNASTKTSIQNFTAFAIN